MIYTLKSALRKESPSIVIMNTALKAEDREGNEDMDTIVRILKEKNPDVEIIITSEEAALISPKELKEKGIAAAIEKPFQFEDVADALDGTYETKERIARERFKIDESDRIIKSFDKAHAPEKPATIRIWEGYASPSFQKAMLSKIRSETANGAYRVEFGTLEDVLKYALAETKNEETVAILPQNLLNDGDRKRLAESGARVIYMDLEKEELMADDISQLGAIAFTGVAYLNENDNALARLYRLLTDDRTLPAPTIDELKRLPFEHIFRLKPAAVHDYDERRRLNERMLEVLLSA